MMKVDADLPFPVSPHLHQPQGRECSYPSIPPEITYPFLEDFRWLKAHRPFEKPVTVVLPLSLLQNNSLRLALTNMQYHFSSENFLWTRNNS